MTETPLTWCVADPASYSPFPLIHLSQKLRTWFGNHTRDAVKGNDARHVLDLSGRANRRPLALQPVQAYSLLFYTKGSALQQEIKTSYGLYTSGDEDTVARLKHLFDTPSPDDLPAPAGPEPPNPVPNPAKAKPRRKKAKPKTSPVSVTAAKPIPFVRFQQAVIRDRLKTMSEEEAAAVERRIGESYAAALAEWEKPWLSATSDTPDDELKREYYQK